jgi:hypothetical protein
MLLIRDGRDDCYSSRKERKREEKNAGSSPSKVVMRDSVPAEPLGDIFIQILPP